MTCRRFGLGTGGLDQEVVSVRRYRLTNIGISMIDTGQSLDRLIFMMGYLYMKRQYRQTSNTSRILSGNLFMTPM